MDRRSLIAWLIGSSLFGATSAIVDAQPRSKLWRIGFLAARSRSTPESPDVYYDAFVQGMRELGYVEGRNIIIEWRFANGDDALLPSLALELVNLKPDVIVTHASVPAKAIIRLTNAIPIVDVAMGDPIALGLATSLSHPGRNVTGLSLIAPDLSAKQLELLRAMIPGLAQVGFLFDAHHPFHPQLLAAAKAEGEKISVTIVAFHGSNGTQIEESFAAMSGKRADAVLVPVHPHYIGRYRRQIVHLALKYRVPSMFAYREDVEGGGLMSYGPNVTDYYRAGAQYVDKILKGAHPSDLPIEQPTAIHMAINRKTANALGLTIPKELLLRADEVIE